MSAFGYFGSKKRIAKKILNKLPPHNAWVELFCGSAAMTMAKKKAQLEVINDINSDIVNFYMQLRNHRAQLIKAVHYTPYAREELTLARQPVPAETPISELEKARRFFVTAMMAINGAFGKDQGGFSYTNSYTRNGTEARVSRWKMMPTHLEKVAERLRDVRIEKKDALVLLENFANRPATLVYVDPPYLGERAMGYMHEANERIFHLSLLKALKKAKCMIFVSGYDNALYNEHLSQAAGWKKVTFVAHTKGNDGRKHARNEIVWMNAAFVRAQKQKIAPIILTKKELRNKKVNPVR